jgi:SAM-dependent methyltransferase
VSSRGFPRQSSEEPTRVREREFFDARASEIDVASMPPREYSPFDSQFEDALLEAAGPLDGVDVLELGCGTGDLTLRLLQRGANVTALDLSPASIAVAERRVARFLPDASVDLRVASAEDTGLEDEAFDLVLGKWVLHHLDLARALPEIKRLLRPGGSGAFVETSALNPLLRGVRRLAGRGGIPSYGTPDERPISRQDLDAIRAAFDGCEVDHPNFVFFYLLDRHLLNWRWARVSRALRQADRAIEQRAPALGRASYFMRIQVRR